MDINNVSMAWYTSSDSGGCDISRVRVCGDYAVFNLPLGKTEFMLIDNGGQEELLGRWLS